MAIGSPGERCLPAGTPSAPAAPRTMDTREYSYRHCGKAGESAARRGLFSRLGAVHVAAVVGLLLAGTATWWSVALEIASAIRFAFGRSSGTGGERHPTRREVDPHLGAPARASGLARSWPAGGVASRSPDGRSHRVPPVRIAHDVRFHPQSRGDAHSVGPHRMAARTASGRLIQSSAVDEKRSVIASWLGSSPVNRSTTTPWESSTTQYGNALSPYATAAVPSSSS